MRAVLHSCNNDFTKCQVWWLLIFSGTINYFRYIVTVCPFDRISCGSNPAIDITPCRVDLTMCGTITFIGNCTGNIGYVNPLRSRPGSPLPRINQNSSSNFNMMKLYNQLVIRLFKDMHVKLTINWPLQNYVIQGFDGEKTTTTDWLICQ